MGEILHPGRRVWIHLPASGNWTEQITELVVTKFKRLLLKGPVAAGEPSSYDGHRERDLIQFWSDHGLRTVAVAEVKLSDPSRRRK